MSRLWTTTLILLLAAYWLWHALAILAATGTFDLRGVHLGTFYLEYFLSLYLPPIGIALLFYFRRRKNNAAS